MKCIITGFEPFGNEVTNPSWQAILLLPNHINQMELIKLEIPTVFGTCFTNLKKAIAFHQPDYVVCVGQAGGSSAIRIEKVAINHMDARIPDNANQQPLDEAIDLDGATAYFSTLPIKALALAMRKGNVPASISYSAGTFVCNDVMYRLLQELEKINEEGKPKPKTIKGGFIHVPYATHQVLTKQDNMPSMELTTMARGLQLALEVLASHTEDDIRDDIRDDIEANKDKGSFGTIQ